MERSPASLGLLHTEFAILRLLFTGPIDRARIAALTGIPAVTCARLLLALEKGGWAARGGLSGRTGGRRRLLWCPAGGAKLAAGLLVEVDRVTATLVDLTGKVLESRSRRLQAGGGGDAFVAAVAEPLREVAANVKNRADRLLGVGVAVPGMVDRASGSLGVCSYHSDTKWWQGFPLLEKLGEKFPAQYFLGTHSNAEMLGELWFGENRSISDMVYVALEKQGIGVGILAGGQVFHGFSEAAGEFGHMTISYDGPLCRCGGRGCMDAYVSGSEIIRKVMEVSQAGGQSAVFDGLAEDATPTVEDIVRASVAGDRIASSILGETGKYLGIGIGNLVNLLNPELVMLGGELSGAGSALLDPVNLEVARMAVNRHPPRIVSTPDRSETNAIGAAAIVLQDIFGSPRSA
jgi:predicted NBD/HSP70 family sugar kinase